MIRTCLKRVNRHSAAAFAAALFLALCGLSHYLGLQKMAAVARRFPVMNSRTEKGMALIDFLDSHRWFAAAFAFLFIGSLLYLEMRGSPRWSVWLTFFVFAVPCLMYLMVCAYISNKFTFL